MARYHCMLLFCEVLLIYFDNPIDIICYVILMTENIYYLFICTKLKLRVKVTKVLHFSKFSIGYLTKINLIKIERDKISYFGIR